MWGFCQRGLSRLRGVNIGDIAVKAPAPLPGRLAGRRAGRRLTRPDVRRGAGRTGAGRTGTLRTQFTLVIFLLAFLPNLALTLPARSGEASLTLAAPVIVWLMASGLERLDGAVLMTRFMFPYIGFMSLVALSAGVLNTWRRFAVPAATPVLLNVAMIAGLWFFHGADPYETARVQAVSVTVGGALQLAWLAGGVVLVETLFAYPGLGDLLIKSLLARDVPVIMGAGLVMGLAYAVLNLFADLLCLWLDPRRRAFVK